ncbi:MAG: phospholipase D-like domain-containing protein [Aerococcus sp.]|nr:phospholipase D-like domain-containing protein [Aerococcus sp.]
MALDGIVSTGMIASTMHEKANHTLEEDKRSNEAIINNIEQIPEDDVSLLTDSMDSLDMKLNLVRHAEDNIDMVYYMFDDSDSATLLLNEIIKAADRGVKVRLLLNDLNNTFTFNNRWRSELLTNNPNISFYL